MNYDTYKNNMLKQGKKPVSREEFEMKKEELKLRADDLRLQGSMMNSKKEDSEKKTTLLGFVGKILVSAANALEKILK